MSRKTNRGLPDKILLESEKTCATKVKRTVIVYIKNTNSSKSFCTKNPKMPTSAMENLDCTNTSLSLKENTNLHFSEDNSLYIILGSTLGVIFVCVLLWFAALGIHLILKKNYLNPIVLELLLSN